MMKLRNYLGEFEDQSWFPASIRESMTDYLRYVLSIMNFYAPVTPLIMEGMKATNSARIIDLCSGGGGPIEQISHGLQQQSQQTVPIILTDKYPNQKAFEFLSAGTKAAISFSTNPVDAASVPENLKGFRTIFSGFHHFDRQQAAAVIKNAVDNQSGIGIFDGGDRNIVVLLAIALIHPLAFFLLTPFFQPFRFSRIIFTYLIPIIPVCTIWDGIVSIIRLYSPEELLTMAQQVDNKNYTWKAGIIKNRLGMNVTYLTGYPAPLQNAAVL